MTEVVEIFLVMQEGGSSREWYSSTYDTDVNARDAIHASRRASYDALGPYALTLPITESKFQEILELVCGDVAVFGVSKDTCDKYLPWTDADVDADT